MESEKGKIVKITFEYENTKEYLSDNQAEEWLKTVNDICGFLQLRNQNPFQNKQFEWSIEPQNDKMSH